MGLSDNKWFTDLQLNEGDFASCPDEAQALSWALDNGVISEEQYTNWASNHYQLPEVKQEFFSMAVDQYLCEKYQDIHNWSEDYFPIYEWGSLLYISCIEPREWTNAKDVCQVIAPRSAMKKLWSKIHPESLKVAPVAAEENIPAPPEEDKPPIAEAIAPTEEEAPPALEIPTPPIHEEKEEEVEGVAKNPTETTSSLDFSALGDVSLPSLPVEEKQEPGEKRSEEETLQNLSFNDLGTNSGADDVPPPPMDDDATPLPDVPLAEIAGELPSLPTETVENPPAPPVEAKIAPVAQALPPTPPQESEVPAPPQATTPTPFNPQDNKPDIPVPVPPVENTNSSIPKEHVLEASDLTQAKELGQCSETEDVVMHIFSHIHKDFEKLMWVSRKKDKVFQPNLVYGSWSMAKESWDTPVEIEKPNIFRIAWNSRMPFHGKVSNNATNQNYFDQWNGGDVPSHITIFPLIIDTNQCEGFVVGFGHGHEFDNHHSYKKLENLLSLSQKQLSKKNEKAS